MSNYKYPNGVDKINLIKYGSGERVDIISTLTKDEKYGRISLNLERILPDRGDMVEIMRIGTWNVWSIYRRFLDTGEINLISHTYEQVLMQEEKIK